MVQQTTTKRTNQYQKNNGQVTRPVWAQPVEQVISEYDTNPGQGLSAPEIKKRREKWGSNLLRKHKRKSTWAILADQFKSLIIALLAAAAVAAFWFGEYVEAWAIGVVIIVNSLIGFFTELRAVRSMEALFKIGVVKTRVRRDGKIMEVDAADLVPGDIIIIEGGDVITADIRIREASRLQADESALTGESLPVSKQVEPVSDETVLAERASMLYKGTSVTRGAGEGVVVATGLKTELGQISSLVEEAEEEQTPLEERLDKLGYRLIFITLFIAVFVAASGIWAGKDLFLMIETGIALAVAAIPEGLPIVATIALAKGIQIMASRNVLINRLSSVETLGATGIICTDKTGTLTENKMSASMVVLPDRKIAIDGEQEGETSTKEELDTESHPNLRLLLETGVLCNNASLANTGKKSHGTGDPLEIALLTLGRKAGIEQDDLILKFPEEQEEAFDAEVKMMATWNKTDAGYRVHVKGAPGAVLKASDRVQQNGKVTSMTAELKEKWESINDELAKDGLRMLALAYKVEENTQKEPYEKLVFLGLVALLDPPREDIKPAIERCKRAGIRVVMVTGDQVETARYIAKAVGLPDDDNATVIHGNELQAVYEADSSSATIDKTKILQSSIFARISPRQKLDLIKFYQDNGDIIAMTGDGVNDAPALKKADIGIAMGQRGTQVAREASDMVLTDDAFSSIVAAIEQGRIIFGNIRRFIYYLMSCNVSEVLVVGTASLIGTVLPILPLQILFLNLVTDVFPALALGLGEGEDGAMERPPRDPEEPILDNPHWMGIAAFSVIIMGSVMGSLWVALEILELEATAAVSISFLTLALAQLWHVFNMRGKSSRLLDNTIVHNGWVWGALVLCIGLVLMAVYVPPFAAILHIQQPDLLGWLTVLGFSLIPLVAGQTKLLLQSK